MKIGTVKLKITPKSPVPLCGYGHRTGGFLAVKEDIYLRIIWHSHDVKQLVFIYGDLAWWSGELVESLRERMFEEFGLNPEELFFVASHNHSGPATGDNVLPMLGAADESYVRELTNAVLEGATLARADLEPVTMHRHDGQSHLNVNRRLKIDGRVEMRPNYGAHADRTLTVISYRREDSSIKALLVHYPCHANLSSDNYVQPDYCGIALRRLDETFPKSTSLFIQGATGDLRPNSVLGDRFVSCSYERVKVFAEYFYDDCIRTLKSTGVPVSPTINVSREMATLPLEGVDSESAIAALLNSEQPVLTQWAEKLLKDGIRKSVDLELCKITLGNELSIFTFNAEVVQEYAAYARTLCPGAITAGYINGTIGYICTADQIAEGGYEPEESARYFALPGTFSHDIQSIIYGTMKRLNELPC